MTIRYLDLVNGNDANDGTTFALRKKTLFSATQGQGDTVRVMASPDPTSMGQSATFTNSSDTITLTTAVTANIDTCETAWTAAANVTATAQSTIQREGANAASLAVASTFTTGLIAYHALGSAMDFSAYQQVSFLIRQSGRYSDLAANTLSICLCSDTAGVTAVNSFTLPALTDSNWNALVFDNAAALGSSIQSIALYALLDPGAVTLAIDNVIACKAKASADSLTHQSLISKNTGSEPWMAIDSINGTTIKLAGGYQSVAARTNFSPKYWGATATQTLYKREPIVVTAQQSVASNGSSSGQLAIEGGWDSTAMTTQSGQTFVRAADPGVTATSGGILQASTSAYIHLNRWYCVNALCAGVLFNNAWSFGEVGMIACGIGFKANQTSEVTMVSASPRYTMHCQNALGFSNGASGGEANLKINYMWGVRSDNYQHHAIDDISSTRGTAVLHLKSCDIRGHYSAFGSSNISTGTFTHIILSNCTLGAMTRDVDPYCDDVHLIGCTSANAQSAANAQAIVKYTNIGGDPTQHAYMVGQYRGGGSIITATDQRHTASDFSWKMTTTSGGYNPLELLGFPLAKVACVASEQRTVSVYCRRHEATNMIFRLRVKGGYSPGITDDITAQSSAGSDTWEKVTIQFTPTQTCVVEVFAEAWGTVMQYLWIDDLEVS